MVATRETFTAQAAPELLATMRTIARAESRDFDATLEDAMRECIAKWKERNVRPEVMAHYRASLEKNRRLCELLAQ